LTSVVAHAAIEDRAGGDQRTMIETLDSDPGDALARALASLGRAVQAAASQ